MNSANATSENESDQAKPFRSGVHPSTHGGSPKFWGEAFLQAGCQGINEKGPFLFKEGKADIGLGESVGAPPTADNTLDISLWGSGGGLVVIKVAPPGSMALLSTIFVFEKGGKRQTPAKK